MKKINTLSVVISAYNEENRIAKTLDSVKFADEIVVVDNSSSDRTGEIAKKYTKKVFTRPNDPMLNKNKNFGFSKATGVWILSLDADEQIPPDLEKEIKEKIEKNEIAGYWIPRKNIIFGKWIEHSIWWPDFQLRLFKRDLGKFPEKHVHEMVEVKGETEKLINPMIHDNYTSVSQFIQKMDRIYTESEVENFLRAGKKINWFDAIRFPVSDFLKTFFAQQGYKDGLHGLVLSFLQAFYAEIVFAKIWERQGFWEYNDKKFAGSVKEEFKKSAKEINFWIYTSLIKDAGNFASKTFYKIARKIRK